MNRTLGKKILTSIALIAIIAQSFSPYMAFPQKAYAQEVTPVVEQSTPIDTPTTVDQSQPVDTVTSTPDQTSITTTPTVALTPEVTTQPTPTTTPDETVTVTPSPTDNLSPPSDNSLINPESSATLTTPSKWTFEKVELNKEYIAPQNSEVKLTFTKLPDPSGNIKIEEITLTAEQIKQTGSLSDKAYDITSDMANGSFTYNLSLPVPEASKGKAVDVKFTEDLSNIASAAKVENTLTKTDTSVSVSRLDHFTIFVVSSPVLTGPACTTAGATNENSCYSTIQAAIDAANLDGGGPHTINVSAGTYNENLTIAKSLTLNGPNVGISGNGSRLSEATVNSINITANSVIIDGFSFVNPGVQMNIIGASTLSGVKVQNNIFSGYKSVGFPTNNAGNLLVTRNLFKTPVADGNTEAMQIKANISGGCTGTTVSNNTFTAATNNDGAEINFSCTGTNSTNVTVSGNTDTGLAGAGTNRPSFTAFSGVVNGIVVTNNAITSTLTSGSGIWFWGGVTGSVDISDNSITGGANNGIDVTNILDGNNTGVFTFTNNDLSGNLQSIRLRNAFGVGATVTAHQNNVSGNTAAGILNESTALVVNATNNWWGNATGPGAVGSGTGDKVSTNVIYKPWCTDSGCTTFSSDNPTTIAATVVTSTTATLNGTVGTSNASNTSFWWGTTSAGSFTPGADPGSSQLPSGWTHDSGTGAALAGGSFSGVITGLTPSTMYHFVAWSLVGGIWYPGANILSFTTTDKYTQADFRAFDGVGNTNLPINHEANGYTFSSGITETYYSGIGTLDSPVLLKLTGYAPIVIPYFGLSWTTSNYVTIGIQLPAGFSGTSVYDAGVMRYDKPTTYPNGYYDMGYGDTPLATTGDASGYLDFSFAANSNNTKKDGLVKLQVIWTANSAPEYFTIDVTGLQLAPNVPTATLTANGVSVPANGYTNSETFTFNLSSADATRYQLKYWNDITGSSYKESTPWNPTTLGAVYPDSFTQGEGTHYFAFSACNAGNAASNCSTYSTPFKVTYDTTDPTAPVNGTPNNTTLSTNSFDFDWDNSTDNSPITYVFQSSQNPASSKGVLTTGLWTSGILPTSMIHSSGAGDGKWYWQVKAIDAAGNESAWSQIWNVTLDTIAPVISGETEAVIGDTTATITWTTDDLATSRVIYDTVSRPVLEAAPNYGYANSTTEDSTKVTSHSVGLTGLSSGTTYYYRVISHGSPEAVGKEKSFATTSPATTTTFSAANVGGAGDGLSDGLSSCPSCTQAPQNNAQILGASTGPAVLGLAFATGTGQEVLGAQTQPAVLGTETNQEVLGTQSAKPTVNPSVSPTTPTLLGKNPVSSSTNWVLTHKTISLLILLVLAGLGYFLYRKRKKKQNS